jgi:AraC family transcriptional regulator, regulatory protein of adaptative response / methylated-DNA-[protein]-cysteine methyltransferase
MIRLYPISQRHEVAMWDEGKGEMTATMTNLNRGQSAGVLGTNSEREGANLVREQLKYSIGVCALGTLLVASSGKGITAILLGGNPETLKLDLQARFPEADLVEGDATHRALMVRVARFVEAPKTGLDLPLDIHGTAFQQKVWQALQEIPAGATASYRGIAAKIDAPSAVRAVASACAANSLAVAIPCHRVLRRDGTLAGYRWGIERKRDLLAREARA